MKTMFRIDIMASSVFSEDATSQLVATLDEREVEDDYVLQEGVCAFPQTMAEGWTIESAKDRAFELWKIWVGDNFPYNAPYVITPRSKFIAVEYTKEGEPTGHHEPIGGFRFWSAG